MKGKRYPVDAAEFVVAWQTSSSVREVSQKLGMPPNNVHGRASAYRKRGIRLKRFSPIAPGRLDIAALNELADRYATPKKNRQPSAGGSFDETGQHVPSSGGR